MAQCSFSGAGGQCGTIADEPGNVGCVSIADCRRKIKHCGLKDTLQLRL